MLNASPRVFLLLLAVLICNTTYSQNARYWFQSAGGTAADDGYDIATDDSNNVYTTGYFTGTAHFVNNVTDVITLNSTGTRDVFICKNDTTGKYKWAIKAGGFNVDRGNAIKVDHHGNVYVTGYFSSAADFSGTHITARGFQDMFIAKYNFNGILQWVRSGGGPLNDAGNAVTVDNNGNVIVTGQFIDTAYFDTFSLISQIDSFTMNSSIDVFTVKYDSTGTIQWAKKGSSRYTDRGLDVGCDPSGNIYVTGQFSDTVTFDNVHNNSIYNAIFLIKYDVNGNEQWFTKAGGGSKNIAYGLAVNDSGNIYMTGDFKGHVIFYGPTLTNLTTTFNEGIFVAKYDSSGILTWVQSSGSDNDLTSRNIALDDSSNAYITGNFKCIFSEYSNHYGQGCFNSVGFNDVFVSKFNSSGQWQWARNYGGQNDDYGRGICVNHFYQPLITGSFQNGLDIPYNNDFNLSWGTHLSAVFDAHSPNCGDSSRYFNQRISEGLNDVFILNSCDPKIFPYYFYATIYDTSCTHPIMNASIGGSSDNASIGPDTIVYCGSGSIFAHSLTGHDFSGTNSPGPGFTAHWSTGSTSPSINVNSSGMYSVTITSIDGCFSSSDSVYVVVHSSPPRPAITDNKGINTNTSTPTPLLLCSPDSVIITVNNAGNDSIHWLGLGTFADSVFNTHALLASQNQYNINVYFVDSNHCLSPATNLGIFVDTALSSFIPKITGGINDTISVCVGDYAHVYVYDSLSDPSGIDPCNPVFQNATLNWTINPGVLYNNNCSTEIIFIPNSSAMYHFNCTGICTSQCGGSDTFALSKNIYIQINPVPVDSIFISGSSTLCTGDSTTLYATTASNYDWNSFPGGLIHGPAHADSVVIYGPGIFTVTVNDTNSFGCIASASGNFAVFAPPPLFITMNPADGIICPGDSVEFMATHSSTYQWMGPSGPIGGNDSIVYGTSPGEYYCIGDTSTCLAASNALEIQQYSTPFLLITPSEVICPGSNVEIDVVTNPGSTVQWLAPLSGSNLIQMINTPGVYNCDITSCGIVIHASVTLFGSAVSAYVDSSGPLSFCPGDSVTLTANPGMLLYEWTPGGNLNPSIVINQSGVYTVTTTDGYGCTAVSPPLTVNVSNSIPPPTLFSNSPLCPGDSLSLFSDALTTNNFSWTGPNGFSSSLPEPVIHNVTSADSGIYTLTVTQSTCINSSTIDVEITALPAVITSSPGVACFNSPDTLFVPFITGATYNWTAPSGSTYSTNEIIFPNVQYSDSGIYQLTVTNGSCSVNLNFDLTVASSVPVPVLSSNSPLCSGDTLHLNSNSPSGLIYQWTGPNGFSSNVVSPVIQNIIVADSGIYSFTVGQGSCSSQGTVHVLIDSLSPITISSNGILCVNSADTISATFVNGATYSWNAPGGTNYSTHEIIFPSIQFSDTGLYQLTVTNGSCNFNSTYNLTGVNEIPTPVLSSNSPLCSGDTLLLNSNAAGGVNFLWTGPNNFSSNAATPIIPGVITVDSGTYSVTLTLGACINNGTTQVSIDTVPNVSITADEEVCLHNPANITATDIPNAVYSWTAPSGTNYSTNEITISSVQYSDTGIYNLIVSKGHCKVDLSQLLKVHDCAFHIPNVFTPNNDGLNDFFRIDSVDIEKIDCKIFNRWGKLIYEWNIPYGSWDGTDQNSKSKVNPGVYFYVMNIKIFGEEPATFKGTIELINNVK